MNNKENSTALEEHKKEIFLKSNTHFNSTKKEDTATVSISKKRKTELKAPSKKIL
ncbi:hypothetical protein P8625_12815 [Tenacibaculum tangerinum]|uniref:Uncharacterized protein n=1 Tax=Tenacibaculum tangerinum TaxID=3038772 RepID=A0ABY8L0G6_9FLAO|nr:hypothetical protein [Tenacibaculum tangerinum]WGH74949.1 hypothetical protein P8625_12815 [Tenacibaculum tangerinum]